MSHRRTRLLFAVPTALLAVSLVGCGNLAEEAAENALEELDCAGCREVVGVRAEQLTTARKRLLDRLVSVAIDDSA